MPTCLNFSGASTQYVPADLRHDSNGWYILYYSYNPVIEGLERRRVRLNQLRKRCKSPMEFRLQVNEIMTTINNQLRTFASCSQTITSVADDGRLMLQTTNASEFRNENARYYTPLAEVIDKYIVEQEKEKRAATMRSYRSFCNRFKAWLNVHAPGIKCNMFTRSLAVDFLDSIAQRKDISAGTYNNFIKLACALFAWAKKKCYVSENPFEGHDRKRVDEKKRTIIAPEHQVLIDQWFAKNLPEMQIVCRLVYTSLLRPIEITRVQVKQIDFENHCIHMPKEKTKTWEKREGRLDSELEEMLRKHIEGASPEDFLFTNRTWQCGPSRSMGNNTYSKAWDRMREELHFPEAYQLYSLKDTAINSMLKGGVDDLSVMQAAGHHDLKMTLVYADHFDKNLINTLNQQAPKFAAI